MRLLQSVTLDLPCGCFGETEQLLRGHNDIGKPIFECGACGNRNVGPLGAEVPANCASTDQTRLATDGGER